MLNRRTLGSHILNVFDCYGIDITASSSVCWFHVGNDVSCHTHTFLIFIQIYIVSETCDSANYVDTVNGISMPASR